MSAPTSRINAAISTMWGIGRFNNFIDIFDQGLKIGFQKFELNHKVTSKMLAEMNVNDFAISAVHEPCPADIHAQIVKDRDWLISSLDEANRSQGVRLIQRSIALARKLGSQVVVIHCGHLPGLRQKEDRLWALFREGKCKSSEYEEIKDRLIRMKADRIEPVLDAVRRSLSELAEYARRHGVRLGLENRYHFSDFPGMDEMEALLDAVDDQVVGFWYDVGHAQTMARLGFYHHENWLKKFGQRMLGAHLHDVKGLDDHYAPGLGEVDWDMVSSYLPVDIHRTLEVQNFNSPQQIKTGMQFLIEKKCLFYL